MNVSNPQTIVLGNNEEFKMGSSHETGTHVQCSIVSGTGCITIREFDPGTGKEHFDGPFELSSDNGGRYSLELDLDKVEDTPEWEVIISGTGEGDNKFLLELIHVEPGA